jgi:hypothetical protein
MVSRISARGLSWNSTRPGHWGAEGWSPKRPQGTPLVISVPRPLREWEWSPRCRKGTLLVISMPRPPREGDGLPDVLQACCKQYEPLKAQAKPSVWDSAVPPEVQISPVRLQRHSAVHDPLLQYLRIPMCHVTTQNGLARILPSRVQREHAWFPKPRMASRQGRSLGQGGINPRNKPSGE